MTVLVCLTIKLSIGRVVMHPYAKFIRRWAQPFISPNLLPTG